jgi:hypothetical protein
MNSLKRRCSEAGIKAGAKADAKAGAGAGGGFAKVSAASRKSCTRQISPISLLLTSARPGPYHLPGTQILTVLSQL